MLSRYYLDERRVEADIDATFRRAMAECSDPQKQSTEMELDREFEWQSGVGSITITPQLGSELNGRIRALLFDYNEEYFTRVFLRLPPCRPQPLWMIEKEAKMSTKSP